MEAGYLQEIKAIIKSLVMSSPDMITIDRLTKDFRSIEGQQIPYRKFGFNDVEGFLHSMADTVLVSGVGCNATLRHVPNKNSAHIPEMISVQKKDRNLRRKNSHLQRARSNFQHKGAYGDQSTHNRFGHSIPRSFAKHTKWDQQNIRQRQLPTTNVISYAPVIMKDIGNDLKFIENNLGNILKINEHLNDRTAKKPESSDDVHILQNTTTVGLNSNLKSEPNFAKQMNPADSHKNMFEEYSESSQIEFEDIDEAIPEFAVNDIVLRCDVPDNILTFGKNIDFYKLPKDLEIGAIIGIFISEIHTPYKFWFHTDKDSNKLDKLMHQIKHFYASLDEMEFCIPQVCINPGQVCAVLYNGLWHRAEILSTLTKSVAKILLVDYGTVAYVQVERIKYLATVFSTIPRLVLRGSLSHIKPCGLHWSCEATKYFLSMVRGVMLYGQVSEINKKSQAVHMVLCDSNNSSVIQINKQLVRSGHAVYDEEWQDFKIKTNGERLHHIREDYPTFSMIEKGKYPTFYEIIDLHSKGIDYENITDQNVYHPRRLNDIKNISHSIRTLPFHLLTTNPFRYDVLLQLNVNKT